MHEHNINPHVKAPKKEKTYTVGWWWSHRDWDGAVVGIHIWKLNTGFGAGPAINAVNVAAATAGITLA